MTTVIITIKIRVTMVMILETINRKVIPKLIKQWLNKFIFHNLNPKKQAVPIIHKVQYIDRIKSAHFNIIKMVKLRHYSSVLSP